MLKDNKLNPAKDSKNGKENIEKLLKIAETY